jgi:hypothetical protein
VLQYLFSTEPLTKTIADTSGNYNDAELGATSGGRGAPEWGASYGIVGGGFLFTASNTVSDYIQGQNFNGMTGNTRGTISIWVKPVAGGNPTSIPFCISNGFDATKTELVIKLDTVAGASTVSAYLTLKNVMQWTIQSSTGILPDAQWANIVLKHNGRTPALFINGVENWTMVQSVSKSRWLKDIFSDSVPADRLIVGGVPRYYQPYIALGFNGQMDEINIWDVPLSAGRILDIIESSSSVSSSSSP